MSKSKAKPKTQVVEVENLGPIGRFTLKFDGPGVTVVQAANGQGKSILLDAVHKLAAGGGKIPLKRGERGGSIDGWGARLSISSQCRHTGEFDVEHLEGRFDLAELVDPGVDKPEAADRKRIRALVALTGAKPDVTLFHNHPAFGGKEAFENVVMCGSLGKEDLVEMAEAIKRDYEKAARDSEDDATREIGQAKGLEEAIGEVDLTAEADEETLRQRYDRARDQRTRLEHQRQAALEHAQARAKAQGQLEEAAKLYTGPTVAEAEAELAQFKGVVNNCRQQVEEFKRLLAEAETLLKDAQRSESGATDRLRAAMSQERVVGACQEIVAKPGPQGPTEEAVAQAEQDVIAAKAASDYGVLIRNARDKQDKALEHRERSSKAAAKGAALRAAAGSIDEVLSSAIKSDVLRVESVDGKARLVCTHPVQGGTVPFHELSAGQKWRIAIDLAADTLPERGVIVIGQEAWEGLDAFVRPEIHAHAKERGVFVLTAEATRDPADSGEMQAKAFEEVAHA